jgi:hypothetical protein
MLAKNRNYGYTAIVMNDHIGQPSPSTSVASERATGGAPSQLPGLNAESGAKDFFGPGGRCKSLKRRNPAKEIKGKPSVFLGFSLGWLDPAWLNFGSAWVGLGRWSGATIHIVKRVPAAAGRPLLREAGKVSPKATDGVWKARRFDRKFAVTFVQSDFDRSSGPHPIRRFAPPSPASWGRGAAPNEADLQ